jgi:hypothetical protein
MRRLGFASIIIAGVVAIIVLAGIVGYSAWKNRAIAPTQSDSTSTSIPMVPSEIISENNASTSNWQAYADTHYGFVFKYPDNFQLETKLTVEQKNQVSDYSPICDESDVAPCLYYVGNDYKNTNFGSAGFSVDRSTDPTKEECIKTISSSLSTTTPVSINDVIFYYDLDGGGGLGHFVGGRNYRTYYNGACWQLSAKVSGVNYETLKEANPGVKEFDDAILFDDMKRVISTFTFTVPETVPPKLSQTIPFGWQKFTNVDIGVSFDYPNTRQVIWSRPDGFGIGWIDKAGLESNTNYDISFTYDGRSLQAIKDIYAKNDTNILSQIKLGGETALLYTSVYPPSGGVQNATIYVSHSNSIFQISINRADADVYDKFLSTFKFTK